MAGKISSIKRPIEVRRTAALDVADFEALSLRACRNVVREGQLIVHRGRTILLPVDFRGPDPRPSVTVVPVINPIKKGPALSGLLVPAMTDNICRGVALKVRPLIPQMAGIGDGHCGQFVAGPFTTTESDKMAALETALVVSGFRGH
ncbi:hypothetical protein Bbelb_412730 [Branchiostoma belcheri]|nr:hypothetical protein Bbelb_412730 [Branchiostoma belcheri]